MATPRVSTLACIAVCLTMATVSADQALTIQSVQSDATDTSLFIRGSNFCASPTVTLDGFVLSVQSRTPTQLIVSQPALAPATYLLVVSCGSANSPKTATFSVTIGAIGAQGEKGEKGDQGIQGVAGNPGPEGPQGPIGPTGPTGSTGAAGATGAQGPAGATGAEGAQGEIGPTGPQGAPGSVGPTGPQGAAGPQGVQGNPGNPGSIGPQGIQGPQGPTGPEGPAGPASAVAVGTRRRATVFPTSTLAFLAPPVTVNVGSGQAVVVTSSVTLGTNTATTASSLRLWMCQQASGGSIAAPHPLDWIAPRAVPNSLNIYTITDTLAPGNGQFQVGLCGVLQAATTAWDSSDWAYTTAQVIAGATIIP